MKSPIKIIVSDSAVLYPPLWGGPKRIWNLYSSLSQEKFNIDYVGIDCALRERYKVAKITSNFRELLVSFPSHYYLWYPFHKAFFKDLGFDLFTYLMMLTVKEFVKIFKTLKADILISSHPWAGPCMKKDGGQLFIYDAHNCEYLLMRALMKDHPMGGIISAWAKRIERETCNKSDIILVCSKCEKEDFVNIYNVSPEKIYIIPNGTQAKPLPCREEKETSKKRLGLSGKKTIFFVGSYYKPNIEAVDYIVDHLAPRLYGYIFLIAGEVRDAFKEIQLPENIRMFGKVPDEHLDEIVSASDIAINPMFSGSGINIKVLDYLGAGLPAITTPTGARGINAANLKDMIICEADEFAPNIERLFSDNDLYERLKQNGRELVKEHFDWKKISRDLESIIEKKFFSIQGLDV